MSNTHLQWPITSSIHIFYTGKRGISCVQCKISIRLIHFHTHNQFDSGNHFRSRTFLLAEALDGPLLLTQRTPVVLLDPQGHAAVVERVVALAPNHHAVLLA